MSVPQIWKEVKEVEEIMKIKIMVAVISTRYGYLVDNLSGHRGRHIGILIGNRLGNRLGSRMVTKRFLSSSQLMTSVIGWALVLHLVLSPCSELDTGSSTRFWKRIRIIAAKIVPRKMIRTRAFWLSEIVSFSFWFGILLNVLRKKKGFTRTFPRILIRNRNSLFLRVKTLDFY